MNNTIFDKIIKLLRLAERATGPEAELALSHAHKLATEHQVDLATLDTTEGERERKEEFIKGEVEYSEKSLSVYIQWLMQKHFRVRTCYNRSRVFFVGRKSDVVFAEYLFPWLMDRFMAEWREEKKKPNIGGGRRSSKAFFYGMYQGLNDKLRAAKKEAEEGRINQIAEDRSEGEHLASFETQKESVAHSYQLAIVNEKDELEKEYYRLNPSLRKGGGRSTSSSSAAGYAAGKMAGARTSIPGIPLNNSSRSQLS